MTITMTMRMTMTMDHDNNDDDDHENDDADNDEEYDNDGEYIRYYPGSMGCRFTGNSFLDASSHLYKRVCPSVRRSVGPSVGPSVTSYFQNRKMELLLHECHQGGPVTSQKCRIASLVGLVGLLVSRSIRDF